MGTGALARPPSAARLIFGGGLVVNGPPCLSEGEAAEEFAVKTPCEAAGAA